MNIIGQNSPTHKPPRRNLPPIEALQLMRLVGDSNLSANSRSALKELIDHANPAIESGKLIAFPTEETLARRIGVSRRTLVPIIEELVSAGFVVLHYLSSDYKLTSAKTDAQGRWQRRAYEIREQPFKAMLLADQRGHVQRAPRRSREQSLRTGPDEDREQELRTAASQDREQNSHRTVRKICNEPCAKSATNREQDLRTIVPIGTELSKTDLMITDAGAGGNDKSPPSPERSSLDPANASEHNKIIARASRAQNTLSGLRIGSTPAKTYTLQCPECAANWNEPAATVRLRMTCPNGHVVQPQLVRSRAKPVDQLRGALGAA